MTGQEDRLAAEGKEKEEADDDPGGIVLGQYVSDDEEEMTCDDVKAYLLRLYQARTLNRTPYTLHPTPYTLHPKP